ncbi:NADH-quinone oxidoreductase subunit L [Bauldia litoralis]|uniref:NADH dehydrogenase subunit L n=1 Tax=Bauldia litoralis TaxID=665467 RepID=A0A1G6AWE9_9HYPH|nr:NADH-quinone oxidoreductase subunit L [Bauldia litoralis]SDB12705.1 NADH dehydrogenase subunit L [Bauldia litoralis]
MYSAIVFLPLIGAIIAGAISIYGAHGRTAPAAANGPGHRAPSRGHAESENGADDHGHDHEPAAVGSRPAEVITSGLLIITAILSWIAFFSVGLSDDAVQRIPVFTWFDSGTLAVDWALRIDTLTVVMMALVTTVSAVVHVYSFGYMAHDPYRPRFFAYLSLFTFAMLALVTSDNLVQLFFGWEGVGLASYLLIGFWYQRPAANAAAIKAFVVNRVGDFGFALGIFGIFVVFNSVEYETIFANAPTIAGTTFHFLSWELDALTVICLLLFMGAMGKSAQFMLHTWLPDAMEGPTPVSALIHAATMVTAGVFMVARLSPVFELSPFALIFVTFIGATTCFFAATIAIVQNDIKRVVAYSTCSQLGYMFAALGVGAYSVGIFHLFTHGFFKALLFLACGSVIHAMEDEQDMRKMGGLRKQIPITYAMMVIGGLALTGFPFTAGYFSKDAIIEATEVATNPMAGYAYVLTLGAALLTALYTWRLIFMTFHGKTRIAGDLLKRVHEQPWVMLGPMMVLAFGALFGGLIFHGLFIGDEHNAFWKSALDLVTENHLLKEMHHLPFTATILPTVMMVIGFGLAYYFYMVNLDGPKRLAARHDWLYRFLLNKWYFDELYDFLFVRSLKWLGRFLWRKGDGWLIDGFGPDGVSSWVLGATSRIVRLQTGYLYHYAFAMLIGVALLVTYLMFAA